MPSTPMCRSCSSVDHTIGHAVRVVDEPPDRSAMERYLRNVLGVIVATEEAIDRAVTEAHSLAAHGKPAEALVQLAWAIRRSGQKVPRWIIEAIHELGDGINDPGHLPPDLDSMVLDELDT